MLRPPSVPPQERPRFRGVLGISPLVSSIFPAIILRQQQNGQYAMAEDMCGTTARRKETAMIFLQNFRDFRLINLNIYDIIKRYRKRRFCVFWKRKIVLLIKADIKFRFLDRDVFRMASWNEDVPWR